MSDDQEVQFNEWYDKRSELMAQILGPEHNKVLHSVIPFSIGGGLDLYYFPSGIPGTAIATKELSEVPGEGASNAVFDSYELVMFTRHPLSMEDSRDESTPFGSSHRLISGTLNSIARYSAHATLNPGETCQFPAEAEVVGGICLIFDAYGLKAEHSDFGLLTLIQIHPSEMEYARANGGRELIEKLKAAGHYPYSDLERAAVV